MPVTFPGHQGLIAPVKLRWPGAIDATSVCIGAAAPDFAYALGQWLNRESHTALGLVVWAIPFTLLAAAVTRRWAAAGIFAFLPDLGPLRLRSYRVLARRRPNPMVTFLSAVLGAGSHLLIDAFTHEGRWGADLLGLNRVIVTVPLRGDFTTARLLQYVGHSFGSTAFVVLLLVIAASGRLETWYGVDEVRHARAVRTARRHQLLFWALTLGPPAVAVLVGATTSNSILFLPLTTLVISLLVAGCLTARLVEPL